MPKLVCVTCTTELKPVSNDTLVIETASFGPYKVWNADVWQCPVCGREIIAGFASEPILEHYEDGFVEKLDIAKAQSKRVEYDHELSRLSPE